LAPGDRIVFYSPRTRLAGGEPVQAFTAIGEIQPGDAYEADMGRGVMAWRRSVRFLPAREAPIRPLLPMLSFTRHRPSWGYAFRRGAFTITIEDFAIIAGAMGADDAMAVGRAE
jgi:hypothetical protein